MAPKQDKTGERLKWLRELAGVSQAQVGYEVGMHREHICMVENGTRNISEDTADKIEKYLRRMIAARAKELSAALNLAPA